MKSIRLAAFACAVLVGAAAPQSAFAAMSADQTAVMATVHQFIDNFNKGDTKTALAACAPQTQIIDEFPPHVWTTCATWADALEAASKQAGDTDEVVGMGTPWHVDVTGSVAYVVIPVSYHFKENGKAMGEDASVLTAVLKKGAAGWKIVSWAWGKH